MTTLYPAAPWTMEGQLWLSLFKVGHDVDARRPRGVYGVALVSYEEPSPLTYSELLVARVVKEPLRAVSITDIWVDSPPRWPVAASSGRSRRSWPTSV
ncbi:MAG: hypothetical protein ACO1ON_12015 [Nocardioides sp.]